MTQFRHPCFLAACFASLSIALSQTRAEDFSRGDADDNGVLELTDGVRIFTHLFFGSVPLHCEDAADTNDSGQIDITDGVFLLNFLFLGGAQPAAPFPGCGADATDDALGCETFTTCRAPGPIAISLETAGGLAGEGAVDFELAGGVLTVVNPFAAPRERRGVLTEGQLTRLLEAARAVDAGAVEETYIPVDNPTCCCDQIVSALEVTLNAPEAGENTSITTSWCSATEELLPQELKDFLAVLAEVGAEIHAAGSLKAIELELESSGGFSGRGSTDFLLAANLLTVRSPFGEPAECTRELSAQQEARLLEAAGAVDWQNLALSYRPRDNPQCCCDQFISQLGVTVTTMDDAEVMVETTWCELPETFPAALAAFLGELQAVGDEVLATCR